MAPGTNIGAAHPVDLSGGPVSEKILNDAVAYARSLAGAHGRNEAWAEQIREIEPPKDVQDAMTKQMSAERSRRAMVTAADGDRQARITVADGEKQAAILKAEGDKQSAILRAEGYSLALEKIFEVARTLDGNTMSLQYLETLKTLGTGPATKFIFPMEFASFLKPFVNPAANSPPGAK